MNPRFPLYIPSKSRADVATTPRFLDSIGVPYRIVVEEQQYEDYLQHFSADKLLILDPDYQRNYNALMDLEPEQSKGSGPARNFIWEHSIAEGWPWHWIMDDNIQYFMRFHKNQQVPVGDGTIFHAMETFVLRYKNVGMAGPYYKMFVMAKQKYPPFTVNTRVFSCNLVRNDVSLRWRGRYNEDTILSLDMLKAGWNTVSFYTFLQNKMATQKMKGGNTEAFYAAEGTLPKSQMLVDAHPDCARIAWRYNRWHHHVDYSQWKNRPLIKRPDWKPEDEAEFDYSMRLVGKHA